MSGGISGDSAIFTLENAPIGIAHVDQFGKFLFVNREYCTISGWPKKDLLQKSWPEITHAEDVMPDSGNVERVLRREIPSYQMDKRYVTKDNRIVWVSLNVWGFFKADNFKHFIVTVEDITDRQKRLMRLEAKLTHAIDEITALNKRLSCDRSTIRTI